MATVVDRPNRWVPAGAVLAVVVVLAAGATLGPRIASTGDPVDVEVAGGVPMRAAAGWTVTGEAEAGGWTATRLERGSAGLTVAATPEITDPVDLIDGYVSSVLPATVRAPVFGEPEAVTLASGRPAVALGYVGSTHEGIPVEGVLVGTVGAGRGVLFDAVAPQGALANVIDDVRAMVGSAGVS